jgi:hypothetical protein
MPARRWEVIQGGPHGTLRYAQGLEFPSKFYQRWPQDTISFVFTAEEGSFCISEDAGRLLNARLRSRGIAAGDTITITKLKVRTPNAERPVTEYFVERHEVSNAA